MVHRSVALSISTMWYSQHHYPSPHFFFPHPKIKLWILLNSSSLFPHLYLPWRVFSHNMSTSSISVIKTSCECPSNFLLLTSVCKRHWCSLDSRTPGPWMIIWKRAILAIENPAKSGWWVKNTCVRLWLV